MRKKFALWCMIVLLFAAQTALADIKVVQPTDDFYVLDKADVLSYETRAAIVLNNDRLYEACGGQIAVVTLATTGSYAIDDYAMEILNQWGVGSAEQNNGMVLLLAIEDDNYYLSVGTGLEKHIAISQISDWLNTYLEPSFAAKNYDAGVKAIFNKLFGEMCEIYSVNLNLLTDAELQNRISASSAAQDAPYAPPETARGRREADREGGGFPVFGALVFILVILLIVWMPRRRRRFFFFGPMMPPIMPRRRWWWSPPPPPPPTGGFGRSYRSPFGSSRSGSDRSNFGGFGGSRTGGGGSSRGSGSGRSFFGGGSSFGGFGSSRSGGFGSGRSSGSFGGSRSGSGFGGGRSGGGGGSRGGGAGRK
ncbi:MAG: TPM domain-containing protein [Christensenellales bacterium]|jgi:uncharacterized protein